MFHLVNLIGHCFAGHELLQGLLSSSHDLLKLIQLIHAQGQARQGDEEVACTALEPGITSQDVVVFALMVVELVG